MTELHNTIPARHIHEECGVFGIFTPKEADVASYAYYALYSLQHRGQESAGIVVNDDGLFRSLRDTGLVSEVFPPEQLKALGRGTIAVGHVRYGTTGSDNKRNVQPILVNHFKGRMLLPTTATSPTPVSCGRSLKAAAPSSRPRPTARSSPTSSCRSG